jgi:type IV pilus assembly protein PilQ
MTRVVSLAALAAVLIAAPARGMDPTPRTTAVTSVSIVPATGKAEVVIGVAGSVDVEDFALEAPYRIVLDLSGATLGLAPQMYDHVARGGIRNIRYAQYRRDVVRVVIDLDTTRSYSISRGSGDVRVSISSPHPKFESWRSSTPSAAAQAPAATAESRTVIPTSSRTPLQSSTQPRITVTYQDADIRDVLAAFAAFSGRTIVVGKAVEGKVTAEVRDQPWDVAMNAILQSQGLAAAEDNNGIITVDSYSSILAKQSTEPLVTQLIPVNYARAASLVETMASLLSKDCPPGAPGATVQQSSCPARGSVRSDSATNTLLVTEVPSRINDLIGYVRDLDVRTPQVAIKAKIIFVNRTDIEDIGIAYDLGSGGAFFNKLIPRPSQYGPVDTNGDGIDDAVQPTLFYDPTVTPAAFKLGGNQLAAIANANQRVFNPALSLLFSTTLGKFSITSFIDALQEVRLADVQAEPSIVTLDNKKARIVVGEETPIRVVDAGTGAGAIARATVSFKETGIILEVLPHITSNRQILMTLHSERSNIALAASDLGYTFEKQLAENQLLVNDGETAVIGGLTVTSVSVSKVGIPLLVDLPLIGRLFGHTTHQEDKRDLLILVTPHIVDDGDKLSQASAPR